MAEKQERTQINADWIINRTLQNIEMAQEQGDTKSINTALKNLADLVGANQPQKIDVNQNLNIHEIKQEMDALKDEYFGA